MTAPNFPDTASPAANIGNFLPYLFNFSPDRLKKWRAARAKVRRGTAHGKILCIGDSTTRGVGGAAGSAAYLNGWPVQLAQLLTAGGVTAGWQNWFGLGGVSTALGSSDSRINLGSWGDSGIQSLGGTMPRALAAATLAFTPTVNCDTFDVYYVRNSGNGTFDINLDGGANLATVNSNGAAAILTQQVTGTLAAHTLNAVWASSTAILVGMNAYANATKQIHVLNAGISSIRSDQLIASTLAWDTLNAIATIAPDLILISVGINDWRQFRDIPAYRRSMQTLIAACKAVADVIIMSPIPSDPANVNVSPTDMQKYINVCYELALANDAPLVDEYSRFVDYSTANTLGYMSDNLHPNGVGYSEMAAAVSNALLLAA